jgi:hypothetical protein
MIDAAQAQDQSETVNYEPLSRIRREAGGCIRLLVFSLENNGQPRYRSKHCSEDYELA